MKFKNYFCTKRIVAFLISFIVMFSDIHHVPASSSYEPLQAMMVATGARVEEWNIHAFVKLSPESLDSHHIKNLLQEVTGQLSIDPSAYEWHERERGAVYAIQAEALEATLHITISAQVFSSEVIDRSPEGYLVVNIEGKEDERISIKEMEEKIMNITKKKGHSPQINTCLIGWLDGKLRDGEWQDVLQKALAVTHAKTVDQLETKTFASYTGYTPEIDQWLQIGDQRINLNMAVHYNQSDHRTYVTIASPVITREY